MAGNTPQLTPVKLRILGMLAAGTAIRAIAIKIELDRRTVQSYAREMKAALGVPQEGDRDELVQAARKKGLLSSEPGQGQ